MNPFLLGFAAVVKMELWTAFVTRRNNRRRLFTQAQAHAQRLGLPLLVVGDPDTGFVTRYFGRDYGCGSVCTDLSGCPSCPTTLPGRLEDVLPRLRSRSHVIYVSCTLEYVDDLPHCVRHIERVAAPGAIYVVRVEPGHSTFWLWPGARWELRSAPPTGGWAWRSLAPRARPLRSSSRSSRA